MLAEQEALTAEEEAAIRNRAAGKPVDEATYNRTRQKQIKNEKYNKQRNKRNGVDNRDFLSVISQRMFLP